MSDVIGTKVAIPGASGAGIIRYVGQIQGKIGTFAGVELLGTLATTREKFRVSRWNPILSSRNTKERAFSSLRKIEICEPRFGKCESIFENTIDSSEQQDIQNVRIA